MKRFFSVLIPMLICTSVFGVDHLFIPAGFDDNDNVEVLVSGSFPNDCYTQNKIEIKVHRNQIQVRITALTSPSKNFCDELKVPFLETITLGQLPSGNYEVVVNGLLRDSLEVKEASSLDVDDSLYAPVDYVELGFTGGLGGEVMLIGRAPDCLEFDQVETISNGKDTVSILPKMKRISDTCSTETTQFQIPVKFDPEALEHDKVLIFVRSTDRKSIHAVIEK